MYKKQPQQRHKSHERRRPYQQRLKRRAAAVVLEPRDIKVLQLISSLRYVTVRELYALFSQEFPSEYRLSKRLRYLFNAGYVARPEQQTHNAHGGNYLIYSLGRKGAEELRERGHDIPRMDFDNRAKAIKPFSLAHPLALSRTIVCLQLGCRNIEHLALKRLSREVPMTETVELEDEEHYVVPDIHCVIADAKDQTSRAYALEIDRATMPVERSSFRQSSFLRHVMKYLKLWEAIEYAPLTVLTITTSTERQEAFRQLVARVAEEHAGLFWFTTDDRVSVDNPKAILTDEIWTLGTGERGSLY